MSLTLSHPHTEVAKIVDFLKRVFAEQQKNKAIIAVSGGIDSSLSLTLLAKALTPEQIFPIILPYHDQSTQDNWDIIKFNNISRANVIEFNIGPVVDGIAEDLRVGEDRIRKGNLMARTRMIAVYDLAKKLDALVVGTENKSEKHLAYFTRFGDEASDIEPIQHLYKSQVRQLAQHLHIPESILNKAPSAGLWTDQTDETEFGFTYEQADQVLQQYIDEGKPVEQIEIETGGEEVVQKVVDFVEKNAFKHHVPYII